MKHNVTFLKRCLALVLALVMIASNANLGLALNAFAVENTEKTVTYGELVANDHPELTGAEKAFLKSGLLADDDEITYYTPSDEDGLVTIDVNTKTIMIDDYYHYDLDYRYVAWTPAQVRIIANNTVVDVIEKFAYDSNYNAYTAAYTYDGEAFTVEVDLELTENIDKWSQYYMLNAAADIKGAMANLAAIENVDTELATVAGAVSALRDVINTAAAYQIDVSYTFEQAVETLENQIDINNGTLTLCALNKDSEPNTKGVDYYAGDYEEALYETYWALYDIQNDELYNNSILSAFLKQQNPEAHTQWTAFKGVLAALMVELEKVYNDPWSFLYNQPLASNLSEADYAKADLLLAAIENPTVFGDSKLTDKEFLVDAVTLRESRDLVSVTVVVELWTVEDAVDSDKLVQTAANIVVVDFPENTVGKDAKEEIEYMGVIEDAIASFGDDYEPGCFDETWSKLPDTLTENVTLTVKLTPAMFYVDVHTDDDIIELGDFPYGYQLTLPTYPDATMAYDYVDMNGDVYRQGQVYTIEGDTWFNRETVKPYTIGTLYEIIGQCWGNEAAQAVLTSGALKGDEDVYYREPNVDLESEYPDLWLENNELSVLVNSYSSGYGNAKWVPYTYGLKDVVNTFNGATVVDWEGRSVNVTYKLPLNDLTEKAAQIVADVNAIAGAYDDQKDGMDSLLGKKADVSELNKMYLAALKGTIAEFDFVDNAAENQALRDYFIGVITQIQTNCLEGNNLRIQGMILAYEAEGMAYYYNNSEAVAAEVATLSSYLDALVGDPDKEAALAMLLEAMGKGTLVEKIGGLGQSMATISAQLSETNDAIDLESDNLPVLLKALEKAAEVELAGTGAPFVISDAYTVTDNSAVVLKADIVIDGKKVYTAQTTEFDKYSLLNADMIAELQAEVDEYLAVALGENAKYYNVVNNVTAELNAHLGEELTDNLTVTVTADAKTYTVKIDGEADQTFTIHNTTIKLPLYPNVGDTVTYIYVYTIDGVEYNNYYTSYKFTTEQIDRLFVDGTYTIERVARDEAARLLAEALAVLNDNTAGNTYYVENGTLYANLSPNGAGVQAYLMGLMSSGYSYIGMNEGDFLYINADREMEMSAQTMVDALLNDETFSEQTIIDLGKNNGGKVLNTTVQLGVYDENNNITIYSDLGFVINLNSVPGAMVDVSKALAAVQNNLHFYSKDGVMVTELTLPEKVYEVYLTAMLAVGEVDTDDMNAINNEIAFMYVYDYINLVLGNENITTQTFQNTYNKFDAAANLAGQDLPNKDLTAYEGAYQILRSIFNSVDVTVNADAPVVLDITATDEGLWQLINASGADLGAYELYLGMLKELNPGNKLEATATVTLTNTTVDFEALVIDLDEGIEGAKDAIDAVQAGKPGIIDEAKDNVKGNGLANSVDYTTDLFARVAELNGPAAIYLLADVKGDLVINHSTVLDLNGKTIDGNIVVNGGKLVIIDSKIATTDAGTVTGKVSGNVTIVSGHYNADVTAFLRDGYTQVGTSVQNAMYTIEREGTEFTIVLNSSFMEEAYVSGYLPSISAVAAEIALDTALNFYIPANLTIEGNRIYGIDDDYSDIFAVAGMSIGEFFDMNLANVRVDGLSNLTNIIIRDLCQFGDIADALENETKLASYTFETNPWAVEFKHVPNGDYMTVGIVADDEVSRDYTLSLKVVGDNIKKFIPYLRELDAIVVYDESTCTIDLKQPVRDGKHMVLEGGATAHLSLDLTVHGDDGIDHDVYKQILAVVFAYGNPDKAETLVNAINPDNDTELNAAINDLTVREVINALGEMNRATSFAEMAEAVGATDKVSGDAATIEHLYHMVACAAGKVLAKLDSLDLNDKVDAAQDLADKVAARVDLSTVKTIVDKAGNVIDRIQAKVDLDSKLGALDQGDGTYLLYYAYERSGSVDYRGFGADLTLSETSGMLKVKIFDEFEEDCLWGDANHDNLVNAKDATLVLQYSVGTIADDQFFCTKRTDVNGDGEINAKDATLILQHSVGTIDKFPVEE